LEAIAVIQMVLVVLVCAGNFALGFALAVYFGHGPTEVPFLKNLLHNRRQNADSR